jgi:hypothetical protein
VIAGAFSGESVQAVERVSPDIAFRVPDGILFAALERREFRVEAKPPQSLKNCNPSEGILPWKSSVSHSSRIRSPGCSSCVSVAQSAIVSGAGVNPHYS